MSIPITKNDNQVQVVQKHCSKVTLTEKNLDFYWDKRIFPADFRRQKFGG